MSTLIADELPVGRSLKYTVNYTVDGTPVDLSVGYTLQVKLVSPDGVDIVDKMVTELFGDNLSFIVEITPAESALATPSSRLYRVCNLLENTTDGVSKEENKSIKIVASCF